MYGRWTLTEVDGGYAFEFRAPSGSLFGGWAPTLEAAKAAIDEMESR